MIYGFLTGTLHFSDAQAAGILGNLETESGFSPTASNPEEGAIGIGQWEGGRRTRLQAYAAAHGLGETDLRAQLGFLALELRTGYRAVAQLIRRSSNPATVAALWDVGPGGTGSGTGFENSAGTSTGARMTNAQSIYADIQSGRLTASRSPSVPGASVKQPRWPAGKVPSDARVIADAGAGRLGAGEFIAWLDSKKLSDFLTWPEVFSVVSAAKKSGAPVLSALHVDQNAGALGVQAPDGVHVYPWKGVTDPGFGERLGDLLKGAGGAAADLLHVDWIKTLVIKGAFALGGLGLAVLGLYAAAHPA